MRIRPTLHLATKTVKALMFAAGIYVLAACNTAGTYNVNTSDDTVDIDLSDGICADADGNCSLRAATQQANADTTNPSTIILEGGETYTLTIPRPLNGFDTAENGGLLLLAPTTIHTNNTGQATINANQLTYQQDLGGGMTFTSAENAIRISYGAGTTTLTNLNIANSAGDAISLSGSVEEVVIDNTSIHDNSGTAIKTGNGTVVVRNSTLHNNTRGISGDGHIRLFQTTMADSERISTGGDTLEIESSTITTTSSQAAVRLAGGVQATITNSIIESTGPNCEINTGTAVTSGDNNVTSDSTCALTGAGDVQDNGNNVKPLTDNGGPVLTQMPHANEAAFATFTCPADVGPDARGLPRTPNGFCDKGAVQAQPGEATGADCITPPIIGPGARLSNCDVSFGTYNGASLANADLSFAEFNSSQAFQANLSGVFFNFANASNSNFREANMTNMNAFGADFSSSFLGDAITTGATFTNATWDNTTCPDFTNSNDNGGTCEGHLSN